MMFASEMHAIHVHTQLIKNIWITKKHFTFLHVALATMVPHVLNLAEMGEEVHK